MTSDSNSLYHYRFIVHYKDYNAGFAETNLPERPSAAEPAENILLLKNGSMQYGTEFYKWLCSFKKIGEDRRAINITGYDEQHRPVQAWVAHGAYPVKIRGLQLKTIGNNVVIDTIELVYERLEPVPV